MARKRNGTHEPITAIEPKESQFIFSLWLVRSFRYEFSHHETLQFYNTQKCLLP